MIGLFSAHTLKFLASILHEPFSAADIPQPSNNHGWMKRVQKAGLIEKVGYGQYKIAEPGFVKAARAVIQSTDNIEGLVRGATTIPCLASLVANGRWGYLWETSGFNRAAYIASLQPLKTAGILAPGPNRSFILPPKNQEWQFLVHSFREMIANRPPLPKMKCIYQSGVESAWIHEGGFTGAPLDDSTIVNSIPREVQKNQIYFYGARRPNGFDRFFLQARGCLGLSWDNDVPMDQPESISEIAKHVRYHQSVNRFFKNYAAQYNLSNLPGHVADLHSRYHKLGIGKPLPGWKPSAETLRVTMQAGLQPLQKEFRRSTPNPNEFRPSIQESATDQEPLDNMVGFWKALGLWQGE